MVEAVRVDDNAMALAQLAQRLRDLLGPGVGVACGGVDGDPGRLYPEERAHVARAVPRRQREYAAGRQAARRAMADIAWPASPLPTAADRSPSWPRGLTGSIAHSRSACVAVVARVEAHSAIGIDVEEDRPLAPELWPVICTAAELAFLRTQAPAHRGALVARLFAAKEAFYKWQYPQTGELLDFHSVHVEMALQSPRFEVHPNTATRTHLLAGRGTGHWLVGAGQLLACFCAPAPY